MTGDDARTACMTGQPSEALAAGARSAPDDLARLLADPSVWATPPADLEDRVVATITTEAALSPPDGRPAAT